MEHLTQNSIIDITNDKKGIKPNLQIIHIQSMPRRENAMERFIIILSDGKYHIEGICTNNLALAIKSGKVKNFSIVRIEEFIVNSAKNGKKFFLKKIYY